MIAPDWIIDLMRRQGWLIRRTEKIMVSGLETYEAGQGIRLEIDGAPLATVTIPRGDVRDHDLPRWTCPNVRPATPEDMENAYREIAATRRGWL